jgi:hypothetical protein
MTSLLSLLGDVLDQLARLLGLRPEPRPVVIPVETRRPGRRR